MTGHKVAIKILNRRKIQAMDMEEKGGYCVEESLVDSNCTGTASISSSQQIKLAT